MVCTECPDDAVNCTFSSSNEPNESKMMDSDIKKVETPLKQGWMTNGLHVKLDRFLRFHPGGTATLMEHFGSDVNQVMRDSNHSAEAFYLLRDIAHRNGMEDALVDWNKPMLQQVGLLGSHYRTWVWKPVDRPLRLFSNPWLEQISGTTWKQVVSVWLPFITYCFIMSQYYSPNVNSGVSLMYATSFCIGGMAVWPLIEYSIHRWIFHHQPPDDSHTLITLHFLLHGLHHKVPFDERRLLFPPVPASVMVLAVYKLYTSMLPYWLALAATSGTILGYVLYDLIHYFIHHGNPKDGTYLYNLKRNHNQHHFAQQTLGFGISSNFWDRIFDTLVKLRNLKVPLTWNLRQYRDILKKNNILCTHKVPYGNNKDHFKNEQTKINIQIN